MGVCISLIGQNKDNAEVNVISSKMSNPNQKGGKRIRRIKTKFPKKEMNISDDDDDEEEKGQPKKEENKNDEDKNINKD